MRRALSDTDEPFDEKEAALFWRLAEGFISSTKLPEPPLPVWYTGALARASMSFWSRASSSSKEKMALWLSWRVKVFPMPPLPAVYFWVGGGGEMAPRDAGPVASLPTVSSSTL